jgi:hypothetical protein
MKKLTNITTPAARPQHVTMEDALWNLTVTELKARLRRAGIPIPKYKDDMVERLAVAYVEAGATVRTTILVP